MKRGVLFFLMLLMAMPVYAMQMTVAGDGDSSSNVKFDIGGDIRLRGYDYNNFWDFNDDTNGDNWNVFRLRTRIRTKATLTDNVSGFIQISNQTYGEGVLTAENAAKFNPDKMSVWDGKNNNEDVFVDNAYLDLNNFFGLPVDLRLGRQNLMYGTGFVLFDGESEAASTAIYFDGIKLTWRMAKSAKLDAFYMKDEERVRNEIGGGDDITMGGAYLTAHCPVMGGQQELYVLNRVDDKIDKNIVMYGMRLSDKCECGLDYSLEGAWQTGNAYRDATTGKTLDQNALGYKLEVGYALPVEDMKLRPFIGYASLSGDEKAGDDDFEGWDVFYGGWPQFGDLMAWVFVNGPSQFATSYAGTSTVGGEANYSNMNLATGGIDIGIGKVKSTISYTKMIVNDISTTNPNLLRDNDYGDYYQLKVAYPYTNAVTFSIYYGMIEPGDAFPDTNDDPAHEFFWETNLVF